MSRDPLLRDVDEADLKAKALALVELRDLLVESLDMTRDCLVRGYAASVPTLEAVEARLSACLERVRRLS
jgi:hypothetical protein